MSKVNLIKKISVKSICGKTGPPKGKPKSLMDVYGIASGVKKGESQYGQWFGFIGSFQATNLETGEVFRSGQCFLPNVAGYTLLPAVQAEGVKSVEFGFRIGIIDSDVPTGFEYIAESLLKMSENDPLELMMKHIPALAAPKKEVKK